MTPCTLHYVIKGVVLSVLLHVVASLWSAKKAPERRQKAALETVRGLGAALWPFVLLSLVRAQDRTSSCLVPSVVFGAVLWALDAASDGAFAIIEPQALHGLFFGLSALVGSRPDAPHAQLFFYAVLIYMLFVLPVHNVRPGSFEEKLVTAVRRISIIYAVGLLIAAGFLTRNCSTVSP